MTKLREVPECLRPTVGAVVHKLPAGLLRNLATVLPGSFTRPESIREAIKQRSKGFAELQDWLVEILRAELGLVGALGKLSPSAISEALPLLRPITDPGLADLAVWLDAREEVSRLAETSELKSAGATDDGGKNEWQRYIERSFLAPLGCVTTPLPAASSANAAPAKPGHAPTSSELERAQEHLRDARKRHADEKRSLESQVAELKKAHAERENTLRTRLAGLETELAELRKRGNAETLREIQSATQAQLGPWFHEATEEESFIGRSEPHALDLLQQADRALEAQAEADRRHGNRVELRRRLDAFRARRDRLAQAQIEAFRPIRSLTSLIERLDHAIHDLQVRLGDVEEVVGVAGEIAGAISAATKPGRLDELEKTIGQLREVGVVSEKVALQLRNQLDRQRKLVALPGHPAQASGAAPASRASILAGTVPAVLLVDAYNLIGVAGSLLGLPTECARLTESWRRLIPMLQRFAEKRPGLDICCMVDSPVGEARNLRPNLRVMYSGGNGQHRADHLIDGHLRHLRKAKETRPILVVSADLEVRESVERAGAQAVSPESFARSIHRNGGAA